MQGARRRGRTGDRRRGRTRRSSCRGSASTRFTGTRASSIPASFASSSSTGTGSRSSPRTRCSQSPRRVAARSPSGAIRRATRASIADRSARDAGSWESFAERMEAFARILEEVAARPAPRPAGPLRELAPFLGLGRKVRGLGQERHDGALPGIAASRVRPSRGLLRGRAAEGRAGRALRARSLPGASRAGDGARPPSPPRGEPDRLLRDPHSGERRRGRAGRGARGAARGRGVELRVDSGVERIEIERGRAAAV